MVKRVIPISCGAKTDLPMSRTRNTVRNAFTAAVSQLILLVVSFVTRMVFVHQLGLEYLGYDSLFTSLLSVLSIADLGILSALNFSLYKPIYEQDTEKTAAILHYFRKLFNTLGVLLLAASLVVSPFLGVLMKESSVDLAYLQKLFLLYALLSFSSYFFTDVRTVFYAHQQNYRVVSADFWAKLLSKLVQCGLLWVYRSYLLYLVAELLITLLMNWRLQRRAHRAYALIYSQKPELRQAEKAEIFKDVKYLGLSKAAAIGVNSTDSLIIAKWVSTAALGVYSNYFLVLSAASGLIWSMINGIVASLGDLFAENDQSKIGRVFSLYDFVSMQAATFYLVAALALIQPFIDLFFGDRYLMDWLVVEIVALNRYLELFFLSFENVIQTKGLFKKEVPLRVVQVMVNLVVSLWLVHEAGLFGVFLGTALSRGVVVILQGLLIAKEALHQKGSVLLVSKLKALLVSLFQSGVCLGVVYVVLPQVSVESFLLRIGLMLGLFVVSEAVIFGRDERLHRCLGIGKALLVQWRRR